MKIYLAASWRNPYHTDMLTLLRTEHSVYDFKNPMHGTSGFKWSDIGLELPCAAEDYRTKLYTHPIAARGYMADMRAMEWADACVMLLPSGRSAHLEIGWFAGRGKRTVILTRDHEEPELMALMINHICITPEEVMDALR